MLDITSDSYLPQAHTLGLVKLMSQGIENKLLFNQYHEDHFIVTFNTNPENIDSQWSGIIVFNELGSVVASNKRAEVLLRLELSLVHISNVFDVQLTDFKNQPENIPIALNALGKYVMFGQIKHPNLTMQLSSLIDDDYIEPKALEQSDNTAEETTDKQTSTSVDVPLDDLSLIHI